MLAAYAASQSSSDPLSGLVVGQRPDPVARPGWSVVKLAAAGLNHHDVWSLQGVGLAADRLPMILGCDGAGVDEAGNEVIIHAVKPSEGWVGDDSRTGAHPAVRAARRTLAEYDAVPVAFTLVPELVGLSFEHAACLSTAWLTAYRMLFVNAGLTPGATVLVQGAGGRKCGTAVIQLGSAAGYRVCTFSRDEGSVGCHGPRGRSGVAPGEPARAGRAVMETTVGAATWSH